MLTIPAPDWFYIGLILVNLCIIYKLWKNR